MAKTYGVDYDFFVVEDETLTLLSLMSKLWKEPGAGLQIMGRDPSTNTVKMHFRWSFDADGNQTWPKQS